MAKMLPSAAMLKGWEDVGKQCYGYPVYRGADSKAPEMVDAFGAYYLGAFGDAEGFDHVEETNNFAIAYLAAYGVSIADDNDINKLTIPQIAAKLEAIGY